MNKNPKQFAPKKNPIPESVWEQIKSGNREPWREAQMIALYGHGKKQKKIRVLQANQTGP